ncbi:MAG: DUF2339 domain-containing protein, partial [Solirubrobacteraceae bacterium]|nr:DUF2339 domain-containing protein [Solirubrobacteraceae bacterium]
PPRSPQPPAPRVDRSLEDLLGGRVLAWVGGAAVIVALALLFALGVSSGAIGEDMRTVMGAGLAALLVGAGLHLHRKAGRTHASLALVGTGITGLFMASTVATSVYEIVPMPLGIAAAGAIGAFATWLAIRWEAQVIGWLGLLGAVSAPLLGGATLNSETAGAATAFVFVAAACASAVVVMQRWDRLALAIFAVTTVQWWSFMGTAPSGLQITLTLLGFGTIGLATAIGREIRVKDPEPALSRLALVAVNALAIAGIGYWAFWNIGIDTAATALLVVLAAVHAALGVWGLKTGRLAHSLALLCVSLGVVFADLAFADLASGFVRGFGFMAATTGFAFLARSATKRIEDTALLAAGLGGHITLALAQTFVLVPEGSAAGGAIDAASLAALAALAGTCLVTGLILRDARPAWAAIANVTGLLVVGALTFLSLEGIALVAALLAEAVALDRIARREGDHVARAGRLVALGLGAAMVLTTLAPPTALADGLADLLPGLGAVALLTGACAALAYRERDEVLRRILMAATGAAGLYLVSLAAISLPLTGGDDQGQLQLTAAWALAGVLGLVVGVRNDLRELRLAALGLIGVAAGKAFLFDLATLAPAQRIGSLLGLGLLLLGGAFAYQRLRPEAPADLRSVPSALR